MTHQAQLTVKQLIDYGARLVQENQPDKARPFFRKALEREPRNVDALLWLAGISAAAAESYHYISRALEIDPRYDRAHAALRWARKREQAERMQQAASSSTRSGGGGPSVLLSIVVTFFVLIGAAATIYFSQPQPVALAQVEQPGVPTEVAAASNHSAPPTPAATATLPPPATATTEPTATPTLPPTEVPTATPLPTATSEPPTPTPEPATIPTVAAQPAADPNSGATGSVANGQRWIDVDLSNQRLVAYEGDNPVYWVTVSTGLPGTPTVTGRYYIYVKYLAQTMSGPGYYLPNVPYVMYFYEGYSIHGTYWHHNFGHPMSHGCVNAPTPDAQWLYNWAEVGTLVNIHY